MKSEFSLNGGHNDKYEILVNDTVKYGDRTLFRIKAKKSFADVREGDLGGYIENFYNLSEDGDCWIYDNAKVLGYGFVQNNAKVKDDAIVFGNGLPKNMTIEGHFVPGSNALGDPERFSKAVWITQNAVVEKQSRVFNRGYVTDNAVITDSAWVYGESRVDQNATVGGRSKIKELACIGGNATLSGDICVEGKARVAGNAILDGNIRIRGQAWVDVDGKLQGYTDIKGLEWISLQRKKFWTQKDYRMACQMGGM